MESVVVSPGHVLLRERTRDAHEATEDSPGMRRLMAGECDESAYLALLRAQWALYATWESARRDWLTALAESKTWRYASRATLLAEDISSSIGASGESMETQVEPRTIAGDAFCWGELYVVEGSALGSRLILRRLRALFPERTHRFYAVGESDPASWRQFQAALDAHLVDEISRQAAIDGALTMFARFRQALQDPFRHV